MSTDDRRDELFRCDHFDRQLARKHCLRRQGEMRLVAKKWVPVHAYCAAVCAVGRETRALLAGIAVEPCSSCGAALVGGEPCAPCQEKRELHVVRRREAPRPPSQDRLWSGEVPDVAIAAELAPETKKAPEAPRPPTPAEPPVNPAPSAKPTSTTNPAPRAPVNTQPPATPAEESTMPKPEAPEQKLCTKCGENPLRSDNESGICRPCRLGGTRAPVTPVKPKPAPVKKPAPVAVARGLAHDLDLEKFEDEELFDLRGAVDVELQRRRDEAEKRFARLNAAVPKAA
jgi:hypothetical protein